MEILQGLKNWEKHKLHLKEFDLWLEGLATNLLQKDFMLWLFKVPYIKYATSNGKTSTFKTDFELKKIW